MGKTQGLHLPPRKVLSVFSQKTWPRVLNRQRAENCESPGWQRQTTVYKLLTVEPWAASGALGGLQKGQIQATGVTSASVRTHCSTCLHFLLPYTETVTHGDLEVVAGLHLQKGRLHTGGALTKEAGGWCVGGAEESGVGPLLWRWQGGTPVGECLR